MKKLAAILIALLIAGCGSSLTTPGGTDDSGIADLINGEYSDLFAIAYVDDDGAVYGDDPVGNGVPADGASRLFVQDGDDPLGALLPVAWGRRPIQRPLLDIYIHIEGDSLAEVTVEADLLGRLYVDTTDDYIKNPGVKPIADQAERYSVFRRNREDGRWDLTQITPLEIRLADPSRQTVSIENITAFVGGDVVWEVSDPSLAYDFPDEIPRFEQGTEVVVEALVDNTNATYDPASFLFLHTPYTRRQMFDDGESENDRVAGDNIYTGTYTIGAEPGFKHSGVDILDSACLQNEMEDDYNSTAWCMPYEVLP